MNSFNTYQAEIDFRRDRIKRGSAKRRHQVPFIRRPGQVRNSGN